MIYGFNTLSDIFDEAIFNLFGSDLNDLFSNPATTSYSKKTYSLNGHTATSIRKLDKEGNPVDEFFIDGKRTKALPEWAVEGLNNTKALTWRPSIFEPLGCNNKLPDPIVSGTEIPHVDMIHNEDGSLKLRYGLIGVSEDRIEISAEDNYLLVTVNPSTASESETKAVYIQRGIKSSEGKLWKKVLIDPKKYDINSLNYTYKDGLLTINIGKAPEPEKNKLVFKKAATPEIEEKPSTEEAVEEPAKKEEKKGLFGKKEKKAE